MKKILCIIFLLGMIGCTSTNTARNIDREEYNVIRGINYSQEGKMLEALREFEKAYGKNPKNIITLREMGLVYANLGDYKKSEEFYKKVLEIDERDQNAIKNLALLNYVKEDYEKSEEYLKMVSKDSVDNLVLKLRGFILFKKGENDKAYPLLKRALYSEENLDIELYNIYSQVLLQESKFMELYRVLEEGYKKYETRKSYAIFYANTLSDSYSEHDKAEKILKRYIANNGADDELLIYLSKISLKNNNVSTAEKSIKMVSDKYRYDLDYLNLKKDILQRQNRIEEAEKIEDIIQKLTKNQS